MSQLPPQTIVLKRKRNDQSSPDTLVIEEQARGQKRRVTTGQGHVFRRVKEDQDPTPQRTASHQPNNGVPVVRATLPGQESVPTRQQRIPAKATSEVLSASAPRRFHLSAHVPTGGPRTSTNGIQKPEGPVFVERRQPVTIPSKLSDSHSPMGADSVHKADGLARAASPLRRPGATSTLKQHGSKESISSQGTVATATNEPPPSQILDEMERFAEEVESRDVQSRSAVSQQASSKLKYKPKAPPLRYKDRHPDNVTIQGDVEMMDVDSDDSDFVYDTYVREPNTAISLDEMNGNIGILVITEEDQELWETYVEDEESDKDWNSEEEDENAENYYGADYPEDEVASDDEHDAGAYQYRHGASDDEEFDSDTGAWSDEEEDE